MENNCFERLRGQRSNNMVIVTMRMGKQSKIIFKFLAGAIVGSNHYGREQRRVKRFLGIMLGCKRDESLVLDILSESGTYVGLGHVCPHVIFLDQSLFVVCHQELTCWL